jgi:hypothetical protein
MRLVASRRWATAYGRDRCSLVITGTDRGATIGPLTGVSVAAVVQFGSKRRAMT